jgi:hypothetical protein
MVSLVEVQRVIAIPKTAAGKASLIKSNLSQAAIPQARSRSSQPIKHLSFVNRRYTLCDAGQKGTYEHVLYREAGAALQRALAYIQ